MASIRPTRARTRAPSATTRSATWTCCRATSRSWTPRRFRLPARIASRSSCSISTSPARSRRRCAGREPLPAYMIRTRAEMSADPKDLEKRMMGAMDALKKELGGLRTGRASVNLLEPVVVEAYGQRMQLNQVGTVSAPEPRLLTAKGWHKGRVVATARAIRDAGLGLNPAPDGQMIRIPIPELTTERRTELAKLAHKYPELARVAAPNARRDGMRALKQADKAHKLTQSKHH